jgi:hypothetical protein
MQTLCLERVKKLDRENPAPFGPRKKAIRGNMIDDLRRTEDFLQARKSGF